MNNEHQGFVSGYAAIIGKPNVGKSTLLNTLLATKVSAVTHKPQTTRKKIVAIYSDDASQIIFLDTPGIFEPNYELQKIMVRVAMHTMGEAEIILYMIDTQQQELDPYVLQTLQKLDRPTILIINKIDLVNKNVILPMIDEAKDIFPFKEIIPTSALKATNTDAIIPAIQSYLPEGPPLFPEDTLSSLPERFFVADAIREQVFLQYGKEIPYSAAVYIEEFREAHDQKKTYIRAVILIERDSQKKILIGKRGDAIKQLGIAARKSIEQFLDRPVFLELFVKTKKRWRENVAVLRSIGYLS
jgi:GTP-binding protein Era